MKERSEWLTVYALILDTDWCMVTIFITQSVSNKSKTMSARLKADKPQVHVSMTSLPTLRMHMSGWSICSNRGGP